jgi:hypothetical protein
MNDPQEENAELRAQLAEARLDVEWERRKVSALVRLISFYENDDRNLLPEIEAILAIVKPRSADSVSR